MKKYLLGSLALVLAIGFSSFTSHVFSTKKFTSSWYTYSGAQTKAEREKAINYTKITGNPTCNGTTDECAVEMNQTTTHPDFTNVTFDGTDGFPNGNTTGHTDFVANDFTLD